MRAELVSAQEGADRLHFAFNDAIERAVFKPETTGNPSRYRFVARRDATVAAEPALVVDYKLELPEGRRYLRKG